MENQSFLQTLAVHIQSEDLTFGDCVRLLRERRDISSRALAAQCGLSSSYVSKVENGERRLDVVELMEIAKAVGFDYRKVL